MLNELLKLLQKHDMLCPGEEVVCAVSGGADSMALLWAMYLLREKLGVFLSAAHFNHGLRGEESDRDQTFVQDFCGHYDIPLHLGCARVTPGKKGLEAAAREARYAFFATLPGKIATAHTADDNAETVLLHLVRGTGLKGLGAIAPVNGPLIRPMLTVTRQQVLAFLREYSIPYVEDSSNAGDAFLRNRLRHHVMPLLQAENPQISKNLSLMAMGLRQDEAALSQLSEFDILPDIFSLRAQPEALRCRMLERFLKKCGVREPEREHIALAEQLVFSDKPSARAHFPEGIRLCRNYDRLEPEAPVAPLRPTVLFPGFCAELEALNLRVCCEEASQLLNTDRIFTVAAQGTVVLRSREAGDEIHLPGGTKSIKKLFVGKKIPAGSRPGIPVICDETGILGVYGIGADCRRKASRLPALQIRFENIDNSCVL